MIRRMFDHPPASDATVHPYEAESRDLPVANLWGQRITSLVTSGDSLYVSTSAKGPSEWEPERYPFLAPDRWKSYGAVYRVTTPGHLGAATAWTDGPTTFELSIQGRRMTIAQDGERLATADVAGPLGDKLPGLARLKPIRWGDGLYGRFSGVTLEGDVAADARASAATP